MSVQTLSLDNGFPSAGHAPREMHSAQKVWPQLMEMTGSVKTLRHSEHTSDADGFAKNSCEPSIGEL